MLPYDDHPGTKKRKKLFGTDDDSYIWLNTSDTSGICFALGVWLCIVYACVVMVIVVANGEMEDYNAAVIFVLMFLSLWAHARVMCGDPGAVPANAHPVQDNIEFGQIVCGRCECYKAPYSHHDRVSGRCISRMDHFCPWMNNAIGAKNQKNFFLFLIYTDMAAAYMYIVCVIHLIACEGDCVEYSGTIQNLVRVLIFLLLFGVLFTSSMIINQVYGLAIGLGTIDRMKLKEHDPMEGIPVPFSHVFGVFWPAYFLPIDPVYPSTEEVFHYTLKASEYCPK